MTILPQSFSPAALEAIEKTGVDPLEDFERLRSGTVTPDELLAELLQGSDGDYEQGFRDYVQALRDVSTSSCTP